MIVSSTVALIVLGGLIGVAAILLWPYVVSVFADNIIPFFRSKLGGKFGVVVADALASLLGWLDGKVTLARRAVAAIWRMFKQKILGMKATYRKVTNETATVETEAALAPDAKGTRKQRVKEREVPLSDLPDEVRKQLEQGATAVEVDVADTVARRVADQAVKQDIPLEELDLRV
jgi:hypothetical protein